MISNGRPVIALIPARGGSKGLTRKNLAMLAGKPLIAHTIYAARSAALVDETWVSSDDGEILAVAARHGALTLTRPSALADDDASAIDVVQHFIASLPEGLRRSDALILYLQPTSPLRNATHIDAALRAMSSAGAETMLSVVEADKPPQKAFRLNEDGRLISLFDERLSNSRRQDLPRSYFPNGAIYAFPISAFELRRGFPSNGSLPFIMSADHSIDIDNADDLLRARNALGVHHG
jgi:CMP-N,N'-diacetyllegionaminic acid synthase